MRPGFTILATMLIALSAQGQYATWDRLMGRDGGIDPVLGTAVTPIDAAPAIGGGSVFYWVYPSPSYNGSRISLVRHDLAIGALAKVLAPFETGPEPLYTYHGWGPANNLKYPMIDASTRPPTCTAECAWSLEGMAAPLGDTGVPTVAIAGEGMTTPDGRVYGKILTAAGSDGDVVFRAQLTDGTFAIYLHHNKTTRLLYKPGMPPWPQSKSLANCVAVQGGLVAFAVDESPNGNATILLTWTEATGLIVAISPQDLVQFAQSNPSLGMYPTAGSLTVSNGVVYSLTTHGALAWSQERGIFAKWYHNITEPYPICVSGSRMVLRSSRDDFSHSTLVIWDMDTGQSLALLDPKDSDMNTVLGDRIDGYTLSPQSLSGDTLVLFGDNSYGRNGTIYRCRFTMPPKCDFNADGMIDIFDFIDFVDCFVGANCPVARDADFNSDGFVDIFDYVEFVTAFASGC